jgi:CheY-like chemotaxis protein
MSEGVMVVDDDVDIRESIEVILSRYGYRVTTVGDGAEAAERLRAGERPALILLDLMMPGMNGEQFRAWQRGEQSIADIPVVVLSGAGRVDDYGRRLGVEVLPKPIELSQLVEVVKRFCARAGEQSR